MLKPDDVAEAEARWMVSTVCTRSPNPGPAEEAVAEPEVYLDFIRQWQSGVDYDAIGAYVEAAPEKFLVEVRAFTRDDVPPPTLYLGAALAVMGTCDFPRVAFYPTYGEGGQGWSLPRTSGGVSALTTSRG
ncbi:hypothetical protein [Streptomyces sp. NPDC055287]